MPLCRRRILSDGQAQSRAPRPRRALLALSYSLFSLLITITISVGSLAASDGGRGGDGVYSRTNSERSAAYINYSSIIIYIDMHYYCNRSDTSIKVPARPRTASSSCPGPGAAAVVRRRPVAAAGLERGCHRSASA